MFNLEQAIAEWRRQMLAAGIKSPATLAELENHLREDVAQQLRAGVDASQAFAEAVRRLGEAKLLRSEFVKASRWVLLWKLKSGLGRLFRFGQPAARLSVADFTASARETLAFAREEAPRLHHDFIGTEHVLLGLTKLQTGVVPGILRQMGVDSGAVRREIEKFVGLGQPAARIAAEIPFTPRAKKALLLAAKEAKALNSSVAGAEHLFLGLLLEGSGVAALVLKSLGVDAERTRGEILKIAANNPT